MEKTKADTIHWKLLPLMTGAIGLCAVFLGFFAHSYLADEYKLAVNVKLGQSEMALIIFLALILLAAVLYSFRIFSSVSKTQHLLEQKRIALDVSTAVMISDSQGRIKYINQPFLKLSGYERQDLLGRNYSDFCCDDSKEEKFHQMWQSIGGKKIWSGEFRNLSKSGQIYWVNSTVVPVLDQQGNLESVVDVRFDITERKKSEEDLLEAKTQAELAHSTKSRFLANMSHEIRTPMNGIIGMTSLLMGSTEDPVYVERLKIIQNCGNSLLDLINDVLDFSKLEVDKVELENEPFAIHETAKEVVELLGTRASEKGVLLYYEPSHDVPDWVKGDETRFRQILTNLVSNGLKFTEKGGVKISSAARKLEDGQWHIEFAVKDSGIGIAADLRERLFQSFSQVDASTTRKFGGTGLGLVISKGLCEKMGGTIRVESQQGKGSTFFFSLKASEAQQQVNHKSHNPFLEYDSNMAKNHPLRILVAEDNRTNQLVILGLLGKFGYEADIAINGIEVLKMLDKKSYDLIFMDSHMPEMDGFAATREIFRRHGPVSRPKIISLSASTLRQDIDRCYESGMDGFIGKPITVAALIKTLTQCRPVNQGAKEIKREQKHMETEKKSVFNSEAFMVHFAGMEDIAQEAVKSFLQSLPQLVQDMEKAIENNDAYKIELTSHTLKGSVSNFCADASRDVAFEIEKMAHTKKYDESKLKETFVRLKSELNVLKIELEKFDIQKKSA